MALTQTRYEHIVLDEIGIPYIAGTTLKVVELAMAYLASGASPEELHYQHPNLTLGQVYSAMAYFWDHRAYFDADIARRTKRIGQLRQRLPEAPFLQRLRAMKQG
jgi:uncharacterized protein (DUF433 family)